MSTQTTPTPSVLPKDAPEWTALHRAVAAVVAEVEQRIGARYPHIARVFRRCYPNTLETTTELLDDDTTFVFTGDIPAMWLRDSSAQVRPYVPLAAHEPAFRRMIGGLIRRQAMYVLIDGYANAFNREPNDHGHQGDRPAKGPWVWERKFELDSLCYPIQLCQDYWAATGDASIFDAQLRQMFRRAIEIMRAEQRHGESSPYRFQRPLASRRSDTLSRQGQGAPVSETGMVWSGFRPSDDACKYGYLIPANMFAVVVLGHVATFARAHYQDEQLAVAAERLRDEIDRGIQTHGLIEHPRHGQIYAYEVDGRGRQHLMDDANVPSLLSIPYLGYRPADDPLYRRTRAFVLSHDNPYYVSGRAARGVGSPHTPRGYVWPIALAIQGLTTPDPDEQLALIETLVGTTAGTDFMHESFHPSRPERFTRDWFAWANSMFGALVCRWAGVS